jgi:hypothetical protein
VVEFLMAVTIVETVKRYLGWCPNQNVTPVRKKIAWGEMNSPILPTQGTYVNNEVIVDYGTTGISLRLFIGILTGIITIFVLFTLIIPIKSFFLVTGVLFSPFVLLIALVMFYRDLKMATLEINPGNLIIRRILHRPVVIRKDAIAKAEVRHNVPPLPRWLQKILILILIPVSSAGVTIGEYLQAVSGEITFPSFFMHLVYNISIVLFFLAIYYHSRVRSNYPSILVITTTTKKLAGIYGSNPEEIAKMLGKSVSV